MKPLNLTLFAFGDTEKKTKNFGQSCTNWVESQFWHATHENVQKNVEKKRMALLQGPRDINYIIYVQYAARGLKGKRIIFQSLSDYTHNKAKPRADSSGDHAEP